MKRLMTVLALATLAGCGADGEPIPPSRDANVDIGLYEVSGAAATAARNGPLSASREAGH